MDTKPMTINGKDYYTMRRFSAIVSKSYPTIRNLVRAGNKFRKLKVDEIMGKLYIHASELTEFPFSIAGRKNKEYYNFNKEGKVCNIETDIKIEEVSETSRSY